MSIRSFELARKMKDGQPVMLKGAGYELAYPGAQLPEYQTRSSAGADFFCAEEVVIPSIWEQLCKLFIPIGCSLRIRLDADEKKERYKIQPTMVHTGVKASMCEDEVLELYNRSSNPKKLGLVLANGVGVVDADYYNNADNDGEIMFAFYNFMPFPITLHVGDKIGQGVFKTYLRPVIGLRVKDAERTGGFGSTGSK